MAQLISNAIVTTVFHIGSFSINSIYSTTEFLINGSNAHISERIEKIDIVNKIKIIEAFISEVTTNCSLKYKKSIHLALESIQSIIDKINQELLDIKRECEYHQTKYFHYWRKPCCENLFTNLQNHILILDERMKILKEIIHISD